MKEDFQICDAGCDGNDIAAYLDGELKPDEEAREVRQGMRRTWIHWAGAVIWSMYLLLENALAIWEWVRWILGAK